VKEKREKRKERRPVEGCCYEIYGAPSYASQMSPLQQSVVCDSIATILVLVAILPTPILPILSEAQLANDGNSSNIAIDVFQPDSKPYGLTYGDWTARWWQWAYSIPKDTNPAYDDTGKYCAEGQYGPVWFLTGTYRHSVD
jgi:hypothetical protein